MELAEPNLAPINCAEPVCSSFFFAKIPHDSAACCPGSVVIAARPPTRLPAMEWHGVVRVAPARQRPTICGRDIHENSKE